MADLTALVREVVGGNPGVMGALVFDDEGRVEASVGTDDGMVEAAVAMCVPLREMLERATASLGCGEMRSTLVQGSKATLAVSDIDGIQAVAVMGVEGAAPGPLLQDSVWLARRLRDGGRR